MITENRHNLLEYGLKEGHYSFNEYFWCVDGKNIKDYNEENPLYEKDFEFNLKSITNNFFGRFN